VQRAKDSAAKRTVYYCNGDRGYPFEVVLADILSPVWWARCSLPGIYAHAQPAVMFVVFCLELVHSTVQVQES
jgi:hypothetical protein